MTKLTVRELIEILKNQTDLDRPVEVAIGQYNKAYPVAYVPIKVNRWKTLQSNGSVYRIEVDLPRDNETYLSTTKRKI